MVDTNGDFIIVRGTLGSATCLVLCLNGDNSGVTCNGNTWNLGKSMGQSITVNKSDSISVYPLPFTDSGNTFAFDIAGVKREFAFNGMVTAPDMECLARFIQVMNNLIDGHQMLDNVTSNTTLDYKLNRNWTGTSFSKVSGTYNLGATFASQIPVNPIKIMLSNFSYSYNCGAECQLQYSVQIVEGDPTPIGQGNQYNPWG